MGSTQRRIAGYGTAAALAGSLLWAGYGREALADVQTLVSASEVQLRMASVMPERDQQGAKLATREKLLADAEVMLGQARAQEPGLARIEELQGFLHGLRGRPIEAAACYRRARGLSECDTDMRDTLVFNEARMLARGGDGESALKVFAEHGDLLQEKWRAERELECAAILAGLGRRQDAEARLQPLLERVAEQPLPAARAGQLLEDWGRTEAAERVYTRAAEVSWFGTYRLALLKRRADQADRSLELLERAASSAPDQVRRLVREDWRHWQGLGDDARIRRITEPVEQAGSSR